MLPRGAVSWIAGGCGIFAHAAAAALPEATVVGVWGARPFAAFSPEEPPMLHHLAVRWRDLVFDAEETLGQDERSAILRFCAREHVAPAGTFMRTPTAEECSASDIQTTGPAVDTLARQFRGWWDELSAVPVVAPESSADEVARRLTASLGFAAIPPERRRAPELVSQLMQLGLALLPCARLSVAETLGVLHLCALRGDAGVTQRDVENYKLAAIRGGYVRAA